MSIVQPASVDGSVRAIVDCYMSDLQRHLSGKDPVQAADILESVREHIESSLAENPDGGTIQAILDDLGSVEEIVAASEDAPSEPVLWASYVGPVHQIREAFKRLRYHVEMVVMVHVEGVGSRQHPGPQRLDRVVRGIRCGTLGTRPILLRRGVGGAVLMG